MVSEGSCPICDLPPNTPIHGHPDVLTIRPEGDGQRVSCPRCGEFIISGSLWGMRLSEGPDWGVSGVLRHRDERGLPPTRLGASPGGGSALLEDLRRSVPSEIDVIDIQDALLMALGHRAPVGESWMMPSEDTSLVYSGSQAVLNFHISALDKRGLANQYGVRGGRQCEVTTDGWLRIAEIRAGTVEEPSQGFIAMWFDEKVRPAREAMETAISGAGFKPSIMWDRNDSNDDIMDTVIAEIRKSRFVVADFTENRGGVYYEAGFAMALGRPVIFTCHEDWFSEDPDDSNRGVHFDTDHQPFITWADPGELRMKLQARIEATIPKT